MKVANILARGDAPSSIASALAGGMLIALNKKDGGIRPICVGEVFRRLVSKLFCRHYKSSMADFFLPSQLGVGVPGGGEAMLHSISSLIQDLGHDQSYIMLKLDFSNAFNRVFRADFMSCLRSSRFSGMSAWVEWCYAHCAFLYTPSSHILSCEGVQQGDPLGPFLFSLSLMRLIERINSECPNLRLNVWYLDDGTLIGSIPEVLRALEVVSDYGNTKGLVINLQKCELWWPTLDVFSLEGFPADIPRAGGPGVVFGADPLISAGVELLGGPIGNAAFAAEYHARHIRKLEFTLQALRDIDDAQIELILLRCCLGYPRMGYAIRACTPSNIPGQLRLFDDLLSSHLESILACPLSPEARALASLPLKLGGLGLPEVSNTAAPAFIASVLATRDLQQRILGRDDLPVPGFEEAVSEFCSSFSYDAEKLRSSFTAPGTFPPPLSANCARPFMTPPTPLLWRLLRFGTRLLFEAMAADMLAPTSSRFLILGSTS